MFGDRDARPRAAERAVALAPDLARTQTVLGFAALTQIDIDQAKAAFERAIALDSADPLPRFGLGLATIRSGDLEAGGSEIEIAAALDPNNSLLRSYLGKAYFEERRDPLGRRAVRDRQGARPERPDALALRRDPPADREPPGRGAARSREVDRAQRQPRRLPLAPAARRGPAARGTSLARIYDDLGFEQLGVNEATKSLSLDPANAAAHRFLSDIYSRLRRAEIARGQRAAAGAAAAGHQHQPGAAEPRRDQPQHRQPAAARPTPASTSSRRCSSATRRSSTRTGVDRQQRNLRRRGRSLGLYDRFSISAGAFGYDTDGWQPTDISIRSTTFTQAAITPTEYPAGGPAP